jgi:hypothetical protein
MRVVGLIVWLAGSSSPGSTATVTHSLQLVKGTSSSLWATRQSSQC